MDAQIIWAQEHEKRVTELQWLLEQEALLRDRILIVQKAIVACEAMMAADAHSDNFTARSYATTQQVLGPRITDKIKLLLSTSAKPLTAREIITGLGQLGFRWEESGRPMATVHSTCHRLVEQKIVEETEKDGRRAWRGKKPAGGAS
jgi:hypothetical protein